MDSETSSPLLMRMIPMNLCKINHTQLWKQGIRFDVGYEEKQKLFLQRNIHGFQNLKSTPEHIIHPATLL